PPETADVPFVRVELLCSRLVHPTREVVPMRLVVRGVALLSQFQRSDIVGGGKASGPVERQERVQTPCPLQLGLLDGTERPGRHLHAIGRYWREISNRYG